MQGHEYEDSLSRPVRLAAELRGQPELEALELFTDSRVLVRLEQAFANVPDARETFLFAINQILRFCPNVAIAVPNAETALVEAANTVAAEIHGAGHTVSRNASGLFDATLNIGTEVRLEPHWITVNSTGWVARVACSADGLVHVPWRPAPSNALGGLAAACLGAGRVFLALVGVASPSAGEFSLFTLKDGNLGSLEADPPLPTAPLELDAFLVGCGAVSNGWAYSIKRLPIKGRLAAIDRQALRTENIGAYVASSRPWVGRPKAEMMKALLEPQITVNARPEQWEHFKIRLKFGLAVPAIIVSGLDNVETRHSVQRLWPQCLIDLAAGDFNSQVIVKVGSSDGICLLGALRRPASEMGWAERDSQETGISVERIRDQATTTITESDVANAPAKKRDALEQARREGRLLCGHISQQNLRYEAADPDFAPAVPFVTAFSGVVGAAETVKRLMGLRDTGMHFQASFRSGRTRAMRMRCQSDCEFRQVLQGAG